MLKNLDIKKSLILLIALMSLVSLSIGVVGLYEGSKAEAAFDKIYNDRVVSIGYLQNLERDYTDTIIGAANDYSQGFTTAPEAATKVKSAQDEINSIWPRFMALQQQDPTTQQLAGRADTVEKSANDEVTKLMVMLGKGDLTGVTSFIEEDSLNLTDPFRRKVPELYETLGNEARSDFEGLVSSEGRARTLQITILILGLAASIFIGLTISRNVGQSLDNVRGQLQKLAAGEGDLTKRISISNDEVGLIASGVNALMERLLVLVKGVQESGIQVTSSATQLKSSSRELETTLTEQVASTNEVVSSAKQISATTQSLVATMADVAVLSREAASSAGSGQSGLIRMGTTMEKMATASTAIAQRLSDINSKATNITSVVTTINKVADQTNLLSLNAAIEAAKAGEFGQGFAVVAREIRRLADQTAIATLDIEQMIKEMQSSVSSGVMGMEKFAQEVQAAVHEVDDISGQIARIIDQVQGLGPRFESVNEGMESQLVGARQITEAMIQLSEATRNSASSQHEAVRAIESLDKAAHLLQREVSRFNVTSATSSRQVAPDDTRELVAVI